MRRFQQMQMQMLMLMLAALLRCSSCQSEFPWENVSVSVQQCKLNKSWDVVISQIRASQVQTGGLGNFMREGRYEVWVCDYDCPCVKHVIDAACFVYDEVNRSFVPWGFQSSLDLMTNKPGTNERSTGSLLYPPSPLSALTSTISGAPYGNGVYLVSSSGACCSERAWNAFDFISNSSVINFWTTQSPDFYSFATGQYTRYPPTITTTGIACAGEWLQISLPVAIYLQRYELYTRINDLYRGPRKYWILGSNDGSEWTVVDSQNNMTDYTAAGKSVAVEQAQRYSYYRIVVNENNGEDWVSISWWKLYGVENKGDETRLYPPSPLSALTSTISGAPYGNGVYLVSSSGACCSERAWNAFDFISNSSVINFWTTQSPDFYSFATGQYTRYPPTITTTGIACAGEWLQISLPVAIYLQRYELYTRINDLYRGPRKYWILGSNDGSEWTVVDSQNNMTDYTAAGKSVAVEQAQRYSYYRIVVNENNGEDWVSISWWKLYGVEKAQHLLQLTRKRTPEAQMI